MLTYKRQPGLGVELNNFITDACRFIIAYASAINSAQLQVYFSALIFAAETSIVRNVFWEQRPQYIYLLPAAEGGWGNMNRRLKAITTR